MAKDLDRILSKIFDCGQSNSHILDLAENIRFSELTSILLHIFKTRAATLDPLSILKSYTEQAQLLPSEVPQRVLAEIVAVLYSQVPMTFHSVEFPPISPLGLNSVVANTSQNVVLSTIRRMEVLSDVSTAMALEYARLKRTNLESTRIDLCSAQRILRMQTFTVKGFTPHFDVFALASGQTITDEPEFEFVALNLHIQILLNFLKELTAKMNFVFRNIRIRWANINLAESLIKAKNLNREHVQRQTRNPSFSLWHECGLKTPMIVQDPESYFYDDDLPKSVQKELVILCKIRERCGAFLTQIFPGSTSEFNLGRIAGLGHYSGPCFAILVENEIGETIPLIDGGFTDWTQKLMNNGKERFLVSGLGTELAVKRCSPDGTKRAPPRP